MNITNGRQRTTMAKVYDRLRKRSQRATRNGLTFEDLAGRKCMIGSTPISGAPWMRSDHAAYVAGVRDALNAVAAASVDA